jgi:conjugative transfer signal peptidase TraF
MKHHPPLLCLTALAAATFIAVSWHENVRLNLSGSMPIGFWRVATLGRAPERGQVVSICLPPAEATFALARGYIGGGECALNAAPLLKPVVAVAGDLVDISPFGIVVNGQEIEGTALRPADSAGRTLSAVQTGTYLVAPGSIWLASAHDPRSFDSRYFGAVPIANVRGVAAPVFVIP